MTDERRNSIISLWAIQEQLLQSYQIILIAAVSVTTVVSGILISAGISDAAACTAMMAFVQLAIWQVICGARAKTVSFLQYLVLKAEQGDVEQDPMTAMKIFESEGKWRGRAMTEYGDYEGTGAGLARKWIGIYLPGTFLVIIGVLFVSSQADHHNHHDKGERKDEKRLERALKDDKTMIEKRLERFEKRKAAAAAAQEGQAAQPEETPAPAQ